MQLKDIMTREVETIPPDASLQEASQKMRSFDIGFLPVCEKSRCIGVITDRDIIIRAIADGRNPQATPVRAVMTTQVIHCSEDEEVRTAAKTMEENQVRRILVLDENEHPIGVCSIGDLTLNLDDLSLASEVLHEVSKHGW